MLLCQSFYKRKGIQMKYLHTMVRVTDVEASLDFYVNKMGMVQTKRNDYESGRFSLIFLRRMKMRPKLHPNARPN